MKIYTKTGDKGFTSLAGGSKVKKNNAQVVSYGDVDELNSSIGVARSEVERLGLSPLLLELEKIQNKLFNVGSNLSADTEEMLQHMPQIEATDIESLEFSIDKMTMALPPLRNFILPGGCPASADLHLARTICRRAERSLVEFLEVHPERQTERFSRILMYLNRLSDYLFVAARWVNLQERRGDLIWKKDLS